MKDAEGTPNNPAHGTGTTVMQASPLLCADLIPRRGRENKAYHTQREAACLLRLLTTCTLVLNCAFDSQQDGME